MHDNDPFQNIKDHHRQNLNEVGDTFKGKLKLATYAARRGLQLVDLQRKENKMQKEKQRLMKLIRSGNAPRLSDLNDFTDREYALQTKGDRMARGIILALGSIRGRPIPEGPVNETNMNLKEYYKEILSEASILNPNINLGDLIGISKEADKKRADAAKNDELENSKRRTEWEAANPYEAEVYKRREELETVKREKKRSDWNTQQQARKDWYSDEANRKKAIEWDAANPRPNTYGPSQFKWSEARKAAGIEDLPEKEYYDFGKPSQKPWDLPKTNQPYTSDSTSKPQTKPPKTITELPRDSIPNFKPPKTKPTRPFDGQSPPRIIIPPNRDPGMDRNPRFRPMPMPIRPGGSKIVPMPMPIRPGGSKIVPMPMPIRPSDGQPDRRILPNPIEKKKRKISPFSKFTEKNREKLI